MVDCSIIIRTKNEEENINHCIKAIYSQSIKNIEIIIVDNCSTDNTIKIVKSIGIKKIIKIKNYFPGAALNLGIKESVSNNIAIISAHCFPKNNKWLENGIKSLNENDNIAGVYGKQLPVNYTKNSDFRDMFITFGDDKRIQIKDSFFHNANSFIKKNVWMKNKFDNKATNIEDRVWAKKVQKNKYKIVYDPKAVVYHPHGIHQNNNNSRLQSTIKILKEIENYNKSLSVPNFIKNRDFKVNCICTGFKISDKRLNKFVNDKNLNFVNKFIFVGNSFFYLIENKKKIKFKKPIFLQKKTSSLKQLLQWFELFFKRKNFFSDYVLYTDLNYKNINTKKINRMFRNTIFSNYDSSTFVTESYKDFLYFNSNTNHYSFLNPNLLNKKDKSPFYIAHYGLGTITKPKVLRKGMLVNIDSCRVEVN